MPSFTTVRHRLAGLMAEISEILPEIFIRQKPQIGHCSPRTHQTAKPTVPKGVGRRETPTCKFSAPLEPQPPAGGEIELPKKCRFAIFGPRIDR